MAGIPQTFCNRCHTKDQNKTCLLVGINERYSSNEYVLLYKFLVKKNTIYFVVISNLLGHNINCNK